MKIKLPFLKFTAALVALVVFGLWSGMFTMEKACVVFGAGWLAMFAMSRPREAWLFMAALTEEQVEEFGTILDGLKGDSAEMKSIIKAFPDLEQKVHLLRKQHNIRTFGTSSTRKPGEVSDDCARGIASAVVLHAARCGKLEALLPDPSQRSAILGEVRTFASVARDMTTTEIPLPVSYGTEMVELIAEFGVARQEMMAYPMSGGQNRPPRWGTRPQFGSIAMSAAFTEKKPTLEFCDLTSKKLGGIVIMPREIDEQSLIPMGRFLAQYGAVEFARAEDTWAFLADGTNTYEGVQGVCKIAADNNKLVTLGAGKTKPSDTVLADLRALRRKVNTAALAGGKYYLNQTWEGALRAYNTVNEKVFDYRPDGTATLDGFPIRWVEVLQPYQDTAAANTPLAVFGRLKFYLFGQRGTPRIDTSEHAYFVYDQIATRFLEELDFDYLSIEAASVLKTAA